MKKLLFLMGLCLSCGVEAKQVSHELIKQKIIERSIESYEGNCPCPYNTAKNGSRCGKRSAYSRAGGETPICYPEDVTSQMIKNYQARR